MLIKNRKIVATISTHQFLKFLEELGIKVAHSTLLHWIHEHINELEERKIVRRYGKKKKHFRINKKAFLKFLIEKGHLCIEEEDDFYEEVKRKLRRSKVSEV